MRTIRVVLAAHGEAETAGFLDNFRVGWRTLGHAAQVMGLSSPLRLTVCALSALRKRLTGQGGSSHNANTRDQQIALQRQLDCQDETRFSVESAFASAPPYVEKQLETAAGYDQQVLINLIPSDSRLSCGLFCHALNDAPKHIKQRTVVLSRLWESPELIDIHCTHLATHFPLTDPETSNCLLLVLHGTLVRDQKGNKPAFHTGELEKNYFGRALCKALMNYPEKPWDRVEIAYLNHGVGGQWSEPTVDEMLARLEKEGLGRIVAYACEHLVDGSETSLLAARLARSSIPHAHCLPCLNADPNLIDFLAARVLSAFHQSLTSMCCDPCPLASDSDRAS
jgi:ferrochelatase